MRKLLFTPGPLTTSDTVRAALNGDWGSRERDFIALTRAVRDSLVAVAGGDARHTCIPLQGSGTFIVEATLDSFVARTGKVLILVNGAYGRRAAEILRRLSIAHVVLEVAETETHSRDQIEQALTAHPDVTTVFMVHCETTTGILNPLATICAATAAHKLSLVIDAMSSFGCIDLGAALDHGAIVVASANKCLQGVPGLGFVIADRADAAAAAGRARSLSFDLHQQWAELENTGQWRFTPPVQVVAALHAAIAELAAEGGVSARRSRYEANRQAIVVRAARLGLAPVLAPSLQSPVIVTFALPANLHGRFDEFHGRLVQRGYAIYPGKVTRQPTFRIGCIGAITAKDMHALADAIEEVLAEMGVDVPLKS